MSKTSTISIDVTLGGDNVPEKIEWMATDNDNQSEECKGMLLSLFNKEHLETVKIDLWTKEMQVVEMDRFFYQTLKALTETYHKATQNNELASAMHQFVTYFGQQTEIIPKDSPE